MTEKRFHLIDENICDEKMIMKNEYVTDLLNELWEDLLFWKKVASQRADEIKETIKLQEELDYYKTKCGSLETALLQGRRPVDKEKEQRMFLVDKEKEQRMFR